MQLRTCSLHPDRKAVGRGLCKSCYDQWYRLEGAKRCDKHPERPIRARAMCGACYEQWLLDRDPEYKARQIKKRAEWAARNVDKVRAARKRWGAKPGVARQLLDRERFVKYGITKVEFDRRFAEQGGKCAICFKEQRSLCVDHCHSTGAIRGLLCTQCNSALGLLGDTEEGLRRALAYLQGARTQA